MSDRDGGATIFVAITATVKKRDCPTERVDLWRAAFGLSCDFTRMSDGRALLRSGIIVSSHDARRVMRLRAVLTILALATLASAPPTASSMNAFGDEEVIVAVLDSGIRATHVEFSPDQVKAWWDFTDTRSTKHYPGWGETWDPFVGPYDDHGHGTAVASVAVGANVLVAKQDSFCAGCGLLAAKIVRSDGRVDLGDAARALRWAVDAGADVVVLSIAGSLAGTGVLPGALTELDEAVEEAAEAGVLVVAAAGNGLASRNLPGQVSWSQAVGFSRHALIVGGSGPSIADHSKFNHDPEVVADAVDVWTAYNADDASAKRWTGTSLAAPRVAGLAAAAAAAAQRAGCPLDADALEAGIKAVARDGPAPPTLEGAGYIGKDEADALLRMAGSCAPPADAGGPHEAATDAARWASSDLMDTDGSFAYALTTPAIGNGVGVLGAGPEHGATEIETFTLPVEAGQRIDIRLAFTPSDLTGAARAHLLLFAPDSTQDGLLHGEERLAGMLAQTEAPKVLRYRSPHAGELVVAVISGAGSARVAYDLALSLDGTPAIATQRTEWLALGSSGVY